MRQSHAGGDRLFVDYAGDTVPVIIDRLTGKIRPAQIFVAVLGASNFTYAEASWTQALGDWIGAHTRAFEAIGGVPNLLVPDNTKVAVIKACLYEPQVNRTYAEMAAHYGTAVLPARPRRPRDKAKVEAAVLIIERWLLGRLRHRRFYSLAELNTTIGEMLRQLNEERLIRRLGVTRRALLEELDRPHLKELPGEPYCFAEWRLRVSARTRTATSEAVKPLGEGDKAISASTTWRIRAVLRSMPMTRVLPTREARGEMLEHFISDEALIDAA